MKISRIIYSIVFAGIILGMGSCSFFKKSVVDDGITLKYNLADGQEFVISSEVVSNFESEQMGQTISVDMNATTALSHLVTSSGEEDMNIEMEFKDMVQTMDSPMGSQDTDFSKLIGKKVSFKLDAIGGVTETKGFSELPEITNATGETMVGEMYEQIVHGAFFKLPDHPVKLGDSWVNNDSTDMPYGGGNLKTTSSTTYLVTEKLEVDGMKCLRIDLTAKSKTSGSFEQQGMELGLERNATSTGHVIFAYEKGIYLSQEVVAKTDGIIDVPAAGMTIPQKITSTTKTVVTL
jgi:hypothetical protein